MTNRDSENKSDDADRCPECGSIETESGDTHEHCSDCGIPRDSLELEPGFVPTNPNPLSGAEGGLGGVIGPTNDNFYRRLDRLHRRVTREVPNFVDGIVSELRNSGVGQIAFAAACEIIEAADSNETLSRKRHKMRGSPRTSREDDRMYRQRIYAAAALLLLFQYRRQESRVHLLIGEWDLNKQDLIKVKKMLWVLVRSELSWLTNADEDEVRARAIDIALRLTIYRDHLVSMEGRTTAFAIHEAAIEIVRQMGEPAEEGDVQLHADIPEPFTEWPPGVVAGRAFFEAMMQHGLSRECVSELHALAHFFNLDYFVERLGARRNDDVEEEA
ncbi:MAG: hypothetical protein QF911_06645 [Candidatus Thalassarchaeaceae archaeon]|nr:hypothetical protein [Candidatus Thalassarchaeaceae archaeon]